MRFQIPPSGIVVAGLSDTLDLIRESFHSPLTDAAFMNQDEDTKPIESRSTPSALAEGTLQKDALAQYDEGAAKGKIKFIRRSFAALIVVNLFIFGFLLWILLGENSDIQKNLLASASTHAQLFPCIGLEIGTDGGYVFSSDGAAIFIPKNALALPQCVSIQRMGSGYATDVYRIGPDKISFQAPVTLIIPYQSLAIARMKIERSGRVFEIPFEVHTPTHTLRARVDHF